MSDYYKLTAHEIADLIKNKEVKALEVAESFATRIKEVEDKVKAYVTVTNDLMLEEAKEVDGS